MDDEVREEQQNEPRVQIGPHPLGGIAVTARGPSGDVVTSRIDLPEATILMAHLQSLITMMFQSMYAQAAQQSNLVQGIK